MGKGACRTKQEAFSCATLLEGKPFPRMTKCRSPQVVSWDLSSVSKSDFGLWGKLGSFCLELYQILSHLQGKDNLRSQGSSFLYFFCTSPVWCAGCPMLRSGFILRTVCPGAKELQKPTSHPEACMSFRLTHMLQMPFFRLAGPALSSTGVSRGKVLYIFKAFMGCLMLPLPSTLLCSTVFYAKSCAFSVYPVMPLSCPSVFISSYPFFHFYFSQYWHVSVPDEYIYASVLSVSPNHY